MRAAFRDAHRLVAGHEADSTGVPRARGGSTMTPSVQQRYDGLADEYHLMFADWRAEVVRQGEVLDRLIRRQVEPSASTVLDCAYGIGTQAIGLAIRGYTVHATDLSPAAVARAAREALSFGAALTFDVADFHALEAKLSGLDSPSSRYG